VTHAELLALLLPSSYARQAEALSVELAAEGNALDAAQASADSIVGGATPLFTEALLEGWERVCGLTGQSGTEADRTSAVLARLRAVGGLSRDYFIDLAAALGYTILIEELQPFRASRNRVGDMICVPTIVFVWQVEVIGMDQPPAVLINLFNELKPAWTAVVFVGAVNRLIESGAARLTETGDERIV